MEFCGQQVVEIRLSHAHTQVEWLWP